MKKFALLLSLTVLPWLALADFEVAEDAEWRAVEYGDIEFAAKTDGDGIYMEWSAFQGEGLDWYKIVRSGSDNDPVYPESDVIGVKSPSETDMFYAKVKGDAYYRVCAITKSKRRACSNVVWVEAPETDETDARLQYQYKKEKLTAMKDAHLHKKKEVVTEKKEYYQEKKATTKDQYLERVYEKLEKWLEKTYKGLEERDMTSEQKIAKIAQIQERLYAWEKGNDMRMKIVDFLDQSFLAWIAEWENRDEFEDIDGFLDGLLD